MAALFTKVHADESKLSVAQIEALIQSCRERRRSGLVRIAYDDGKQMHLFFKRGETVNVYLVSRYSWEESKPDQWPVRIQSSGEAYTRIIPISVKSILLSKILLQEEDLRGRVESSPVGRVHAFFDALQTQKKTTLARFEFENFDGLIFVPGFLGTAHAMLFNAGDLRDEESLEPFSTLRGDSPSKLTLYNPSAEIPAWQEYLLRRSFASVCERTLSRFEVMAGRSLSDSLVRLLIVFASRHNLDINVSASRKIVDREIFTTPQDAAREYKNLLNEMFTHFSGVMGGRLLSNTLRELIGNLPEEERNIITQFNLLPEGYFYGF